MTIPNKIGRIVVIMALDNQDKDTTSMQFETFRTLSSTEIRSLLAEKHPHPIGVGIPFNGTRRWYMATFQKTEAEVYTQDYLVRVTRQIIVIMGMMIADGINTVYTPIIGRDLRERGEEYMQFGAYAVETVAMDEFRSWYIQNQVRAGYYGELNLLPDSVQETMRQLEQQTRDHAQSNICYGIFADQAIPDLIQHTVAHYNNSKTPPTPSQLVKAYYGAEVAPLDIWVGSDQPTIFDVPLMQHGNTALYFLQFPTLYLNQQSWRRLLYDFLFIRGDQETLYPDNITSDQQITGLGERSAAFWKPATR